MNLIRIDSSISRKHRKQRIFWQEICCFLISMDDMNRKQIVGGIAGDDTVMAAVRTVEDTYEVMDEIKKVLAQ